MLAISHLFDLLHLNGNGDFSLLLHTHGSEEQYFQRKKGAQGKSWKEKAFNMREVILQWKACFNQGKKDVDLPWAQGYHLCSAGTQHLLIQDYSTEIWIEGSRPLLVAVLPAEFKCLKLYSARILKEAWWIRLHCIQGKNLIWVPGHYICYYCIRSFPSRIIICDDDCVRLHCTSHQRCRTLAQKKEKRRRAFLHSGALV